MDEVSSRLNAMEQGVRARDAGCNLDTVLRQSIAQPLWHRERHEGREHEQHREMLTRVKEFDGDVDKLLAEYQQDIGIESGQRGEFNQELKDCVAEPRRVSRREPRRESLRMWLRVPVCLRESLRGLFRVWIRVRRRVCLHAERKRCAMALGNQLSVDKRDCERMRVQVAHSSVALNKSNASADSAVFHALQTVARNATKLKQVELWQLEKCDVRFKSWKARVIQPEALGAKRECLSKLVARVKHDRIDDDDAEDECNEEVLCDCFFTQCIVSPGASPHRSRTECEVRRDSCAIVSFKTVRRRVVQTSSQVMCDSCRRSVSPVQGCLFSDAGQSHFKQEQFSCTGCWMVAGVERWESHECNKLGQLQTDYSVHKRRIADRVETTASARSACEYDDEDYVFEFGHEVSVDVQRRETHICIGGASRSACWFGGVSELTMRSTTPPLSPSAGSSIEQHGYKKVHWKEGT